MPTVLRSGIVPILQAIRARLVLKAVVTDPVSVKFVVGRNPKVPHLDAQFDVVAWVRGFTAPPVPSCQTGTGRYGTRLTRRLDLLPRTRMLLDQPDRHEDWMFGSGNDQGYFAVEERIIDALLVGWVPQDANGNHLTACDIHLFAGADPEKVPDDTGWGAGSVSFEIVYRFPATQALG